MIEKRRLGKAVGRILVCAHNALRYDIVTDRPAGWANGDGGPDDSRALCVCIGPPICGKFDRVVLLFADGMLGYVLGPNVSVPSRGREAMPEPGSLWLVVDPFGRRGRCGYVIIASIDLDGVFLRSSITFLLVDTSIPATASSIRTVTFETWSHWMECGYLVRA